MIAKLEWTLSNAKQNQDQTQIINNELTDSHLRTDNGLELAIDSGVTQLLKHIFLALMKIS